MPELTTTATFMDGPVDEEALTTIVARSVLEAALAEDGSAELWFEIAREDAEPTRLAIDLSADDLEALLRLSGGDDVALSLDGDSVAGLFDDGDADVEAHGMRGAIVIAVTSAALLAPAAQAAVPQAMQQATPQAKAQVKAQVSAAATAQVSSLAARTQVTMQNKAQVSKAQVAKASGLTLLRSGIAR